MMSVTAEIQAAQAEYDDTMAQAMRDHDATCGDNEGTLGKAHREYMDTERSARSELKCQLDNIQLRKGALDISEIGEAKSAYRSILQSHGVKHRTAKRNAVAVEAYWLLFYPLAERLMDLEQMQIVEDLASGTSRNADATKGSKQ